MSKQSFHIMSKPVHFFQANLLKRVKDLKAIVSGCSEREISILAVALENLQVNWGFDGMKNLAVIQVETRINQISSVSTAIVMF